MMDVALLLARLLLATVFAVAGIAKLTDWKGTFEGLQEFELPVSLARPAATLIPVTELLIAMLLLPTVSAWWGALGALLLLSVFIAAIGYQLGRGQHPQCHCFGRLHSAPASQSTLVRNGALVGIALFVVAFGRDLFSFSNEDAGHSIVGWRGGLSLWGITGAILAALVLVAIVVEGWAIVQLLRQNGRLLLRMDAFDAMSSGGSPAVPTLSEPEVEGLPVGTAAPPFALQGLHGDRLTLDALRASGKPVLLLFTDPDCEPCSELLPEVGDWQREHADAVTIALISHGSVEANRLKVADEYGIVNVMLQKRDGKVSQAYQADWTPSAVLIQPDGTIGSPVAGGVDEIRELFAEIIDPQEVERTRLGEPAPEVSLPDLNGQTMSLMDFSGKPTLVLFWDPACGFCQHVLPDLRAWEDAPPANAPQLLIVSTGSIEDNRAMRLKSTILLDRNFEVGGAFGASGTPSAVMVGADGTIASELAEGFTEILSLAGGMAHDRPQVVAA